MHQRISTRIQLAALFVMAGMNVFGQETGFPLIRNYAPKEYKGDPQIWSVLQDKNTDIMYFGALGIMSYDGATWKEIPMPNKTYVYSLAQDQQGKIYAGAVNDFGFLETDAQGKTVFKSLTPLLQDTTLKIGTAWSVNTVADKVYFQADEIIFQYTPSNNKIKLFHAGANNGTFRGDFIYNDSYYVRLSGKGLLKIENDALVPAPQSEFFKEKNAFYKGSMVYTPSSLLIATRREGVIMYDLVRDTVPRLFPIQNSEFLSDNDIYTAFPMSENIFALGSSKKGLLVIDRQGNTVQQFIEGNNLQTNGLYDINKDKNQNIWLGLENGISKSDLSPDLSYWDQYSGLKGAVTNVIRFQNKLYITTYQTVYYLDEKNRPQEIKEIPVGQSWALKPFKTSSGKEILLVGTHNGIYEIENTTAKQVFKGEHAFLIYQSSLHPERIFSVDGYYFISLIYKNGSWTNEGKWAGINDYVLGIEEDKNGDLWMGTLSNGILRVTPDQKNITKPKKVHYYTEVDGKPSLKSSRPFLFRNKMIWGTEKGLFIYNATTDAFEPFCELGKQFCDGSRDVGYLHEMRNGRIYISPGGNKKEAVGYLEPTRKGTYDWVYQPFCRLPEIALIIESGGMYVEDSGIVWIGGNEGLFRYDERKDSKAYKQSYRCLIREVKTTGDSIVYYGGGSLSGLQEALAYKYNTLKFQFAAPFFDQEEKTVYSYWLNGFDESWSPWSSQTEKEYTNLREGSYSFNVKAKNVYGVESELGTFEFTVLPPYYRTWWAYSIYVITSLLVIFWIVKTYTRSLRRQKEHLEQVVKERTAEVHSQNQQLQNLNATKDKFFSIISHDIKGPLHSVTSFSDLLVNHGSMLTKEEIQTASQDLNKSVKNLFALLDNLLEWSLSQTGALEFTAEAMNVTEVLQQNKDLLDPMASQKKITIRNNVDTPYMVYANKNSVATVFRNLISNAIKFTPPEGSITIEASIKGNEVITSIRDTGVGISKKEQEKLFHLGTKHTTKGTGNEKGTGLGLILCKDFIEKNGGRIWVESEPEKGSVFFVALPLFKGSS